MKNITITIDDKIHKLTDDLVFCSECSLYHFCKKLGHSAPCPASGLGGESFVELKVEK
jgi:hypothetical protein